MFSVTPVRIYMMPKDRAVAVTITNEASDPVVLQADIYEWRQSAEGEDQLTPSEDLILAPPIVKLGAKAKQVVRLARLQPPDASRQLIYRMILREAAGSGALEGYQRAHRARALDAGLHHAAGGEACHFLHRAAQRKRNALRAMREPRQRLRAGARSGGAAGRPGRRPLRRRRLYPARGA